MELDFDSIPAKNTEIRGRYRSRTGISVVVKAKRDDRVILKSLTTGHDIEVPADYVSLSLGCRRG